MHPLQLYARLRARFAAGVGHLRDTVLPRYAAPAGSMRRMRRSRKDNRHPETPAH
jgi:hypothetical protein